MGFGLIQGREDTIKRIGLCFDDSPFSKTRWKIAGFSLLELMVVLLVIGMVLALTFPKFQNLLQGDIKSVSIKMIGTIQYLYDEASFRRKVYRLNFDLTEGLYWGSYLEKSGQSSRVEIPVLSKTLIPDGVKIKDVVVLHEGKVTDGKTFTEFYPNGGLEKTTIHLEDKHGKQLTLQINPLTGRVRVHEGYRDFFEG